MKVNAPVLYLIGFFCFSSCQKEEMAIPVDNCFDSIEIKQPHPKSASLDDIISRLQNAGLPGISMLVYSEKVGQWQGATGRADLGKRVNFKPCTPSRIGSVSKSFTAVIVMQLIEEGILHLDDRLGDFVSVNIKNKDIITVKNLLNHTSGIKDYTGTMAFGTTFINSPSRKWNLDELINFIPGNKEDFFPGTNYSYSNSNYILLQRIIETKTGMEFRKLMNERLFGPLQLQYAWFDPKQPVKEDAARGYMDLHDDGKLVETTHYAIGGFADGGVTCNVFDLFRFLHGMVNHSIINAASFQAMQEWVKIPEPEFQLTQYGLGLRYWETPYGYGIGHTGGAWGYLAEAFYFPEQETYVCFLVNGSHGKMNDLVDYELHNALPELLFGD